ncbi:hypothetical protein BFW87_12460 [Pseudomonas fluorescens]|uniref:Uncharacterized protein n=1 Tax=Pseudomonas fluorescens TaxID=294 RepID=A0A1T2YSR3_PSEFL|nr:hypothetical protein BFW87_12460 [Pseudomonas fluorescens]
MFSSINIRAFWASRLFQHNRPEADNQIIHVFDIALLYWSKAPSHMAHQPKKARIITAITAMAHVWLPTTIISC